MIGKLLTDASVEQLRQSASSMGIECNEIGVNVTGETQNSLFD
jgi:hypothetical protein